MEDVRNKKESGKKKLLKDFSVLIISNGQQVDLELHGDGYSMLYGIIATLFEIGDEYDLDVEEMVKRAAKRLRKKE